MDIAPRLPSSCHAGAVRPLLLPGLRWAWRTRDTVQFGIEVPLPLVVTGLPELARDLLPLLDGSRDRDQLVAALDAPGSVVDVVLERLLHFGVLIDGRRWPGGRGLTPEGLARLLPDHRVASTLPRFRADPASRFDQLGRTRVVVEGLSRLGATVWTSLTAAGVARVDAHDTRRVEASDVSVGGFGPTEVGRQRSELPALRQSWVTRRAPRYVQQSLHVLTDAVDVETRSRRLVASGTPHLVVTCQERIGRVGPLVVPGTTPCRHCITLARRDRDPGWAQVWRQLDPYTRTDTDASLVGMTAHLATAHVLEWMTGGEPTTLTGQLELTAPEGTVRLVPVARHPECGCAWPDLAG